MSAISSPRTSAARPLQLAIFTSGFLPRAWSGWARWWRRSASSAGGAVAVGRRCRRGGSRVVAAPSGCRARANQRVCTSPGSASATTTAADRGEPRGERRRRAAGSGSMVTRRQPAPWTSSNGRPSTSPWTNRCPACGDVGWTSPASRPGRSGTDGGFVADGGGHRVVPRRGRGVGSGTQMTLPSSIENSIAWRALGSRSSWYVSSSASGAWPPRTRSSFQARLAASRMPAHMPCPANGGIWWAASPASSTRPVAPLLGVAGVERVHGVALEAGVARVHVPRREQLPRALLVVEVVERLVGQPHELPAAPAGPAGHRRRRSGRVADLQVDRVEHARLVEDDVDDQPVEEEAEVVHAEAGEPCARCCWRRRSRRRSAPSRRLPSAARDARRRRRSGSSPSTSTPRRTSMSAAARRARRAAPRAPAG